MAVLVSDQHKADLEVAIAQGAALLLAAGALALRLHRLAAQSLWYDEAISLALAGRSVGEIARNTAADLSTTSRCTIGSVWQANRSSPPASFRPRRAQ